MLIKNGTVICENETKVTDILIEDGIIVKIADNLQGTDVIDASYNFV